MPTRAVIFAALILFSSHPSPGKFTVSKVEPPNWWSGMKLNALRLMIYGAGLDSLGAASDSDYLKILEVGKTLNPSYVFLDIEISPECPPALYNIFLYKGRDTIPIKYPVLKREDATGRTGGFDQSDVIYLITPDRFADGDTSNDYISGMLDGFNPDSLLGRHGGDIKGIINKLDYIKELGVTAIWINPLLENNTDISYHGYAATDFYKIDPRFGTNELYRKLVVEAHKRGLKIILDHVSNHISINHPWINNLPSSSWLNGSVREHMTNRHWKTSLPDIHSDSAVRQNTTSGWFADYMPDLNQKEKSVAGYIIQNTIWWIEYAGLDGIREDTYSYADPKFMSAWALAVLKEYPSINIVGEVWLNDPVYLAPYMRGCCLGKAFDSNLPSLTDYALFVSFMRVFGSEQGRIDLIHECLTKDFLYPDAASLVIFLDNHDVTRIMSICKGDIKRYKLALKILLTTRGIPQILYGTEIGMKGGPEHGEIRSNFPGGFPKDTRSAFTKEGRTSEENEIFDFLKNLISLRKAHKSLSSGRLIHLPPAENVYNYFRTASEESTFIAVNNGAESRTIKLSAYRDYLKEGAGLKNLETGEEIKISPVSELRLEGSTASIYMLIR